MKRFFQSGWLLVTLFSISSSISCQSQTVDIKFDNETLIFPMTVKEAVENYRLLFRPPGYYYRKNGNREMRIAIIAKRGDYDNEGQDKEVLYDREVISYVFTYEGTLSESDSIRLKVEQLCNCELKFVNDTLLANPPSIAKLMPQGGNHVYGTAKLSENVTVGFRNKPNFKGEIIPEVRFFYKQSPAQIRKGMMQY